MKRTESIRKAAVARRKKRAKIKARRDVSFGIKKKGVLAQSVHGSQFYPVKKDRIYDRVWSPELSILSRSALSTLDFYDRFVGPLVEVGGSLLWSSWDIATGKAVRSYESEKKEIKEEIKGLQGKIDIYNKKLSTKISERKRSELRQIVQKRCSKKASLEVRRFLLNAKWNKLYEEGSQPKYCNYGLSGLNTIIGGSNYSDAHLMPVMFSSTSLTVQKLLSPMVSGYYLPSFVSIFIKDTTRKHNLSNLKQKYVKDEELSGFITFLENKHFMCTDFVGLVGSIASFSFGVQEIGSWFGLNRNLLEGMGKIEKWAKTGLITGVASFTYKKGYGLHLMRNARYWKKILEETDSGFVGEKSKELLALENELNKKFDGEFASDELNNIIRGKAVLGLLESDRTAVAYTMFMRLQKEGLNGPTASFLEDLGLPVSIIGFLNNMNGGNKGHVKIACDALIEVFKM